MKSVAIKAAKQFEIKEIKEPKSTKGSVVIEVKYAGICGSDIHYWDVGQPKGLVLGHEISGTVLDPGSRKDLKVGDRVTAIPSSSCGVCPQCKSGNPQQCRHALTEAFGLATCAPGGLAPRFSVRAQNVLKMPDNVSFEEGAMVEPTAVGLHAVKLADIKVGDKVLVVGAGIIGLVSAMFAKLSGASFVAISETNPQRGKTAVKLKVADQYLDACDKNFAATAVTVSGGGFDRVIECCGVGPAVNSAFVACRPGGTVVLVGVSMAPITINSIVPVVSEQVVKGAFAYTDEDFKCALDLMSKKIIDVKKFMSKIVSLEEVQASYEELTSGKTTCIKILVDPHK